MKVSDSGGGDFQRPDPGTYLARCVRIIDVGTQEGFEGGPDKRQVVLAFELPTELIPDGEYAGQPFMVSKFYTASLHEKANLRHDLEAWRTKPFTTTELEGFDLVNVLGKPCMVTVTLTPNKKTKVAGVTACPKGTTVAEQFNPSLNFSLEPGEFDPATYDGLSDWFKETIAKSPEYQALKNGAADMAPEDFRDVDFGGDAPPF
jgi:hypothetical protein